MRRLLLAAAIAVMAGRAEAWTTCTATSTSNNDKAALSSNGVRVLCHDTAADTATDSGILAVSACGHIEISFNPSLTDASIGAEAQIYSCDYDVASTTLCRKLIVDTDFDGIPDTATLDGVTIGRQGQQWQTADWIFVDMTVAPSGGDIARTKVSCFP